MRNHRFSWAALLAASLVAPWLGCKGQNGAPGPNGGADGENGGSVQLPETPADGNGSETTGEGGRPSSGGNGGEGTPGQDTTTEPDGVGDDAAIPEVRLPELLQKTCLVGVGDLMPDAPLDVLGGGEQPLSSQFGRRLTLMFFWEADDLYAQDELRDLTGDVVEAFGEQGVRVIGINVGDSAEKAAAAVEGAEANFPNFLDPKGEYFAKVANERLPRTYLLDPQGRILWFDLEYSPTTRRQLKQALGAALRQEPGAKPPGEPAPELGRPEAPTPAAGEDDEEEEQ
jgi:peroxiredoxin